MTYIKQCDVCHIIGKPTDSSAMSLTPILALASFKKWRIEFVGFINSPSRHERYQYIFVATNHVTKWVEAEAIRKDDKYVATKFLRMKILSRCSCLKKLVSDQGTQFVNDGFKELTKKYKIKHRLTSSYHT